jgi:hypothetical protein
MKEILEILIVSGMLVSAGIYLIYLIEEYKKGNTEITLLHLVGGLAIALTSWVGVSMMVFDEYLESVVIFKKKEVKK